MPNGNYGGAVVLASDNNDEAASNLVATTRINQSSKPTLADFESAEVLVCNFGEWQDKANVNWHMPDIYHKENRCTHRYTHKILYLLINSKKWSNESGKQNPNFKLGIII